MMILQGVCVHIKITHLGLPLTLPHDIALLALPSTLLHEIVIDHIPHVSFFKCEHHEV